MTTGLGSRGSSEKYSMTQSVSSARHTAARAARAALEWAARRLGKHLKRGAVVGSRERSSQAGPDYRLLSVMM
ncbi:hypothetical protein EVAR_33588_1 [Eumeta japonica]|uniref:Uncharacterized protein n=1 Tax=Eumeta variegata TaxID=151549 RepID=A0A4C1WBK8_EUMVA|nr:hypothetical protein EVAR_33588_1 [Eumeta japonica]